MFLAATMRGSATEQVYHVVNFSYYHTCHNISYGPATVLLDDCGTMGQLTVKEKMTLAKIKGSKQLGKLQPYI